MGAIGPWRSFRDLERWVRNLESSFPRAYEGHAFDDEQFASPAIESFVKDGNLVIRADVPGISPKDIEVSLLGDVLTIRGERREESEIKKENYLRREISYGSLERRLNVPHGIDSAQIKATTRDGVIEITIPLQSDAEPKKINVVVTPAKEEEEPTEKS
ncbi:MAG TPA: Hsp20/alpha crystallin family protein [Candidatus Binataceae bacterium]|nr:Hsp20/alpha crystallin family protein [Candidatus Binataceae bacterium]